MKMLWRLSREAIRYKTLYVIAILSTLALTGVNLAAPKALSAMTGVVERGVDEAGLHRIGVLTAVLVGLYLLRVLFRFLSSYLSHKAAWYLVGDLRTRVYDKLERMHLGYFHDKQTGDLMSRVVNDTRDFELLYAHMIPESITNLVTFLGVLIMLLTINPKLALITCAPIPLILISGVIFSKKVRPFFRISQKKMGELNAKLQDNLSGVHEIQSFGREEYETERVNERNFEHVRAMLYGPALFRQSRGGLCAGQMAIGNLHDEFGDGEQSIRDRFPCQGISGLASALVYTGDGGGALRARHPRLVLRHLELL